MRRPQSFTPPLVLLVLALATSGCADPGSITPTPKLDASDAPNLVGEWLLVGSMPSYFVSNSSIATNVAISFGVNGTSITGSAQIESTCATGGPLQEGFVGALQGTVAQDGTFTASFPSYASNTQKLTISGTVPTTAGAGWNGQIAFTSGAGSPVCVASFTDSFTAIPVPAIQGNYKGSGPLTFVQQFSGLPPAVGTTYSVSTDLAQDTNNGSETNITGTIQTSGFPCFTHGATTYPQAISYVSSNNVNLSFVMDDGASLSIASYVSNTAGTQIAIQGMYVRGDNCAGNYFFSPSSPPNSSTLLLNQ